MSKGEHRAVKILKKAGLILIACLVLLVAALIMNNRICYFIASRADMKQDMLTQKELQDVNDIYTYLKDHGSELLDGFDGSNLNLILYNESYEFLLTENQSEQGWEFIKADETTGKNVFRRNADHPQAFAVRVNTRYAGSFATHDYYNKSVIEQIPVFYPPQLLSADDTYYKAIAIHELVHAYEGNRNKQRLDRDEHYHDVCQNHQDSEFKKLLVEEAEELQLAVNADSKEEASFQVHKFLETRNKRRERAHMTVQETMQEVELEWLEGCARYVEMNVAKGSKSLAAKNLGKIKQHAGYNSDDRYYTLGMAQIMILEEYMEEWQQKTFVESMTLEECLALCFD